MTPVGSWLHFEYPPCWLRYFFQPAIWVCPTSSLNMIRTYELYGVSEVIIIVFPDPKCGDPKCESFNWKPKKLKLQQTPTKKDSIGRKCPHQLEPKNPIFKQKIHQTRFLLEGRFLTIFQGQAFAKRRLVPCGTWRVTARSGCRMSGPRDRWMMDG